MAARRNQKLLEQTYRILAEDLRRAPATAAAPEELQEADVWGDADGDPAPEEPRRGGSPRRGRRGRAAASTAAAAARSVPVEVPGWGGKGGWAAEEDASDGEGEVVPPHVYLWRRRRAADEVAAFSVEEGWGRTLKGRDLSRVRNAVWEKIGFLD